MEMKKFINEVPLESPLWERAQAVNIIQYHLAQSLLSAKEIVATHDFMEKQDWIPVGLDGIQDNYQAGDPVGSYRLSIFSEAMADAVWSRLEGKLPSDVDDNGDVWRPVGVNPLFRFIKYAKGGELIPHYDAPYCYHDKKMTRKSLVIYLTSNTEGFTDFLFDDQLEKQEKDYQDKPDYDQPVISRFIPNAGAGLIFDHRIIHKVSPMKKEKKIIIRTDIIYQRT